MKTKTCFVIMGFGMKTDYITGKIFDLDKTYKNLIKKPIEECGYKCYRSDEISNSGHIDQIMYELIVYADLVIADISTLNPNAIYELGVRHAAKPARTLIIAENGLKGNMPFDLNHTSILFYEHLGSDIGYSEVETFSIKIKGLITNTEDIDRPDSPFFTFIKQFNGREYSFSEEERLRIMQYLDKDEYTIYKKSQAAQDHMKNNLLAEARQLWKELSDMKPNELYFKQQLAICTYKSKQPNIRTALEQAKLIIDPLLVNNNDPETLGIAGSIHKRLFLETRELDYIVEAKDLYLRNYVINSNYYNGENYAVCCEILAKNQTSIDRIKSLLDGKEVREKIYFQLLTMLTEKQETVDDYWIYATISNQALYLDEMDNYNKFDKKFKDNFKYPYELITYEEGLEHTNSIKKMIGDVFAYSK